MTEQDLSANGKSKKTRIVSASCPDTGPTSSAAGSSKKSPSQNTSELTLFAGDFRARTYPWQASARAWLEREADSGMSSIELLESLRRAGASSKTFPDFFPLTEEGISSPLFEGWRNSGIASRGQCWTANTREWRNGASVCSLSEVLETEVAPKYFLSQRACAGILHRAAKRGKTLPVQLEEALKVVAFGQPTLTTAEHTSQRSRKHDEQGTIKAKT